MRCFREFFVDVDRRVVAREIGVGQNRSLVTVNSG